VSLSCNFSIPAAENRPLVQPEGKVQSCSGQPRIRILHLIETLGRGGAEGLLYANLSKIDRTRFDSIVCHLYDRDLHWRQPILELGYPVYSLGMTSLTDGAQGILRLRALLRREAVDLIHTHLCGANLLGRIAGVSTHIPVISSVHSVEFVPALSRAYAGISSVKLLTLHLLDRFSRWVADPEFLAVSRYAQESALHYLGIKSDRIRVIYNAIDPGTFEPTGDNSLRLRSDLGITAQAPVVLCVSRFHPEKGIRYLIEAIPLLASRFSDICVLSVGGGTPEAVSAHRALAERLGVTSRIRFLGLQADVRPYLQLCDVFVLPSLAEGFGLSLVEAMAMERACVATRVTALPEVVADGRSGLLVEPASPPALAEAIARLIESHDLRAKMGAEGRRIVHERFNIDQNIHQLEAFYEEVIRKARAHPS